MMENTNQVQQEASEVSPLLVSIHNYSFAMAILYSMHAPP